MKKLICTCVVFVICTMAGFFINRLLSMAWGASLIEVIVKNISLIVIALFINTSLLRLINIKRFNAGEIISFNGLLTSNFIGVIAFLILSILTYVLMVRNGAYNPAEIFRATAVFTSITSYFLGSLFGVSVLRRKIEF